MTIKKLSKLGLISLLAATIFSVNLIAANLAQAQSYEDPLYSAPVSPKPGWQQFPPELEEREWWMEVIWWLPNRLLDLVDVFKVDVGVGPAYGAGVKVTEYGQAAYRKMDPFSFRIGAFGRQAPVMVETSDEIGIGPNMQMSLDRQVCPGELGIGADLFLFGGYAGICLDELVDFSAGLFFIDLLDDDF